MTGGSPQRTCYNWAEAEVVSGGLDGAQGYVNLVGEGERESGRHRAAGTSTTAYQAEQATPWRMHLSATASHL